MKVGVIGAGAWGTAFSLYLARLGNSVKLWVREPELLEIMRATYENVLFLPGKNLPENVEFTGDASGAAKGCEILVFAVPVQKLRGVLEQIKIEGEPIVINLAKGIEEQSLLFPSELIGSYFSNLDIVSLSGPSFAVEVAEGRPTVLVAASHNEEIARYIRDRLSSPELRIYSSGDVVGVELGGALKNVIAIAAGIVDAIGLGDNARAALITRGLAEMTRLAIVIGAKLETMFGLAGLGDLLLTATSEKSRNYQFGRFLGKGAKVEEILKQIRGIPEGVWTARAALKLAENFNVELPITYEVHSIIKGTSTPPESVRRLMEREYKDEWKDLARLIAREAV